MKERATFVDWILSMSVVNKKTDESNVKAVRTFRTHVSEPRNPRTPGNVALLAYERMRYKSIEMSECISENSWERQNLQSFAETGDVYIAADEPNISPKQAL